MKNIHLKVDDEMHKKMIKHKISIENKIGTPITWESYVQHLFGFYKEKKK